jgi:hypothetical protein
VLTVIMLAWLALVLPMIRLLFVEWYNARAIDRLRSVAALCRGEAEGRGRLVEPQRFSDSPGALARASNSRRPRSPSRSSPSSS